MPNDPKFVRLAAHMASRTIADITGGSGWSISGGDVQPFPTSTQAKRYVRQKLAAGILEPSSKAELEEIASQNEQFAALRDESPDELQEGKLQDLADELRAERAATDNGDDESDEDDEDLDDD